MWRRSASFIMDKCPLLVRNPMMCRKGNLNNPYDNSSNGCRISFYCRTRSGHHTGVTNEWLDQAYAAAIAANASAANAAVAAASAHTTDAASTAVVTASAASSAVAPHPAASTRENNKFDVIEEFNCWRKKSDLAEAVAAIMALVAVIRGSEATTMMELVVQLRNASDALKSLDTTSISLSAGCDLFARHVATTSVLDCKDFNAVKLRLIKCCKEFGEISLKARTKIAMFSQDFISDGCTILVHGYSRVVLEILKTAAANKKLLRVLCTDGLPDRTGLRFSTELAKLGIPVKIVMDSAVGYIMDEVNMILVGADGIVQSGGIINMIGTYPIAVVAHSMDKPVYVAAESYRFSRLYPLDQKDLEPAPREINFDFPIPAGVEVEKLGRDYTPPKYLSLFFTNLGVFAPSTVSDEIIRLYL